jgi:ABC-2 type transport system ATP-binding protein
MQDEIPARTATGALIARGLRKVYASKVVAVDGLDFVVRDGSTTALLGGNGAGKTTTIGMLMGLILPTSGAALVLGTDMARERHRVLHRVNFQSPYVDMPMRLSVRENLSFYGQLYGLVDIAGRIAELAELLRLTELLDRPAGKLSAGQKTRLGLAKALINAPEVLLLDEPTASLDPDTADWVRGHLQSYRKARGATILLASHNMAEVERLADRVIMLERGRLIEDDAPEALVRRYRRRNLEEVFLDVVRGTRAAA